MAEQASPLITFYKQGWENYQQAIVKTIALLSSAQLALPVAPHYLSIRGLLDHMIGARFLWFHLWMGEGDPNLDWNDDEDNNEPASLVAMFEKSWRVISSCAGYLRHLFQKRALTMAQPVLFLYNLCIGRCRKGFL